MKELEPRSEGGVERDGNVAQVIRPEGTYSIIYGMHVLPMDPEVIPSGLDYLVFETATTLPGHMFTWVESPATALYGLRGDKQTSPLFGRLAKDKTPIVFADVVLDITRLDLGARDFRPFVLEGMAGVALTKSFIDSTEDVFSRPISRRSLLKFGGLALAAHFLSPAITTVTPLITSSTGIGNEPLSEFEKAVYRIHPETLFLSVKLRNIVLAHKQNWLMKKLGVAHAGTVIGAAHKGLEVELQASEEERLGFLKKTERFWYQLIFPESFYKIVVMKFDGKDWVFSDTYEVPELKDLAYQ